jgi:hypothetical protein
MRPCQHSYAIMDWASYQYMYVDFCFSFVHLLLKYLHKYCHMMEWLQTGLWIGIIIGFIEHLQVVTTSNYNANAKSHILQFTRARTKSSQSAVSSPVVVWLNSRLVLLITPQHGLHRNTSCSRSSIVASYSYRTDRVEYTAYQSVHWCVLGIYCGHYLAVDFVYGFIT